MLTSVYTDITLMDYGHEDTGTSPPHLCETYYPGICCAGGITLTGYRAPHQARDACQSHDLPRGLRRVVVSMTSGVQSEVVA